MPWSGGVFSRFYGAAGWGDDKNAGTPILSSRHDTHDQDIATAITFCLNKDNSTKPEASFAPSLAATYDLGTSILPWRRVYGTVYDAQFRYDTTAEESGAAITPVNFTYPPRDLRRYSTGTGTTGDPYLGWQAVIAGLGGKFFARQRPGGGATYYNATGGSTINRSVEIEGDSVGLVTLRYTGVSGSSVPIGIGAITFNGTPRPAHAGTVYNAGTAALTVGQTSFTFASVAGLAVGDYVCMYLGVDPNDGGQSFLRLENIVDTIVGTTVTMRTPLPEAVAIFPGAPAFPGVSPTFHEVVKPTNGPVHVYLHGFTIEEVGAPGFDVALYLYRCSSITIGEVGFRNISGTVAWDIGESFNVAHRSFIANKCAAAFGGIFGTVNGSFGVLECNDLTGAGLTFEVQCRQVNIDCLRLAGNTSKAANPYVFVDGQSKGVSIQHLYLSNKTGATTAQALIVPAASDLVIGRAFLGNAINVFPLKYVRDGIYYGGVDYKTLKRYRITLALSKSMSLQQYTLPNGLCRSMRVQVDNKTGVTFLRLYNATAARDLIDVGNTVDVTPAAGTCAETTDDWPITLGTDTASYAMNAATTGRQLRVSTDTNAVEATRITLDMEFFVSGDDGVGGRDWAEYLSGTFTGTLVNCDTAPTLSIDWRESGGLVFLKVPQTTAAKSTTTNVQISGLPSALRPTTTQWSPGTSIVNNSASTSGVGEAVVNNSTNITLFANGSRAANTFTNSGNAGPGDMTIYYNRQV